MKPLSPKIASRPHRRDCYGPGTPTDAPSYCSLSRKLPLLVIDGLQKMAGTEFLTAMLSGSLAMTGLPIQGPPGGRWASGRPQCSRLRNRFPRSPATVEPVRRSLMSPLQGGGAERTSKGHGLLCSALELLCQALLAHLAANVLPRKLGSELPRKV